MKKYIGLFMLGLFMGSFSLAGIASAERHLICPDPANGPADWDCYYGGGSVEFRGKPKLTPMKEILKEETIQAKKEAKKLSGKELIAAANAAIGEAEIAKIKVAALNNRIIQLRKNQAENKKKGVKTRDFSIRYGNCTQVYNDFGFPIYWYCF